MAAPWHDLRVADDEGALLLLMRHGKAAWPDGVGDHERPLAKRGRRDAPAVGRWLAEQGLAPHLVICSDAARTRETAALLLTGLGTEVEVRATPDLYEAGVQRMLHVVAGVPDGVRRLLLVGHEPTSSATTAALTGSSPAFPTAAVAAIRLTGRWDEVCDGAGSLIAFHTPRD